MAREKRLNRYLGKLTPKQIAQGINCANSNAERLIRDAELLCHNGRYPSAVGLAILAIEEEGKVSVLRGLAVARNAEDVNESWKAYRTHTEKNRMVAMYDLASSGARKLEDFRPMFEESDYPQLIENLKQISLYTDCLGKAHWSIPDEVINENLAKRIIDSAKVLVKKEHEVTEKEVELWIKYIRPVWKKNMALMKAALKSYFIEMHSFGLLNGNIEDYLSFVEGNKYWMH